MSTSSLFETLARIAGDALAPLAVRLQSGQADELLEEVGLRLPTGMTALGPVRQGLQGSIAACAQLPAAVSQLVTAASGNDDAAIINAAVRLAERLVSAGASFAQLGSALDSAVNSQNGLSAAQKTRLSAAALALPERLLHLAVISWLEDNSPQVKGALDLAGLIDDSFVPADPVDPSLPSHRQKRVRLDRLAPLVSNPMQHLSALYGFGTAGFNGAELFSRLKELVDSPDAQSMLINAPGQPAALDAFIFRLAIEPGAIPGLRLRLRTAAKRDFPGTVPLGGPWSAIFNSTARFDGGLEFLLHPQDGLRILPPQANASVDAAFGLRASKAGNSPMILIGQAGGSRIELESFEARLPIKLAASIGAPSPDLSLGASMDLHQAKLVIDASQADGFIGTILGGVKVESAFDLGAVFDAKTGLKFTGSATFELAIPAHLSLGPVTIPAIYLIGGFRDGKVPIEFSVDLGAQLGPLNVAVSRIGAQAELSFPKGGGNAGPVQIDVKFKPPTGLGLSIDAGVIRGGGYLSIDPEKGEYAGALELTFAEFLSLKAIGIITTKMPDGSKGFSLLIIITAEFGSTGLQLGYGFTLLGVGGLIGINRTVRLEALIAGVRNGAVNNIMFPRDIVANAPRIISDLRTIFPPENGTFLIGPMAKLGWGTPTLVSISLGIIIEIPGNIAILGVLRVALPAELAPVIVLQVSFVGAIEFDRKRLYFFASLFDSRILFITIDGDMGMLAAFGDDANFVLSIGGFHPRFTPPPLPFPVPTRISVSILNESWARLRAEGYFAVTSNTVQFGARAEAFFGFDALSVEGGMSLDALIQFSPFRFIVEISSHWSVKVFGAGLFGVSVQLSLEGPTPWRAKGRGSISLLFFDISVDFDETWGERRDTSLPSEPVLPILVREYAKKENWRAFVSGGKSELVTLRKLDAQTEGLVLHPSGVLRVLQRAVPLDISISKVGNSKSSDGKKFTVGFVSPGMQKIASARERFASAQFNNLSDQARLSAPAFEEQNAGLDLSPSGTAMFSATAVKRSNRYELITIDSNGRRPLKRLRGFDIKLSNRFLAGNAVALSVLSAQNAAQKNPFADKLSVKTEGFAVAFADSNRVLPAAAGTFASEADAREFLNSHIAGLPAMAGAIHVVPAYELAA